MKEKKRKKLKRRKKVDLPTTQISNLDVIFSKFDAKHLVVFPSNLELTYFNKKLERKIIRGA